MAVDEKLGLTRENGDTIGFVLTCFFSSAIDKGELREWCFKVIGELESGDAPAYLFDLADTDGRPADIYRVLGFVPGWRHSSRESSALFGIAIKRGKTCYEWPITAEEALDTLSRKPAIEARFRATFPFIEF